MKRSLTASLFAHGALLLAVLIGLPSRIVTFGEGLSLEEIADREEAMERDGILPFL